MRFAFTFQTMYFTDISIYLTYVQSLFECLPCFGWLHNPWSIFLHAHSFVFLCSFVTHLPLNNNKVLKQSCQVFKLFLELYDKWKTFTYLSSKQRKRPTNIKKIKKNQTWSIWLVYVDLCNLYFSFISESGIYFDQ